MNAAVIVIVTVSTGVGHVPPRGTTTRPGGSPFVTSVSVSKDSLIRVKIHLRGWALLNVNVAASLTGCIVVELNASAGGAATTTGGTTSASAGESGGGACPGGIEAGRLLS